MTDLYSMSHLAIAVALASLTAETEQVDEGRAAGYKQALVAFKETGELPADVAKDLTAYLEGQAA